MNGNWSAMTDWSANDWIIFAAWTLSVFICGFLIGMLLAHRLLRRPMSNYHFRDNE